AFISPDRNIGGLILLNGNSYSTLKLDVIFPVLHGKNGEDGTIQGLFEIAGIPYVGCDVISSAMCMDKAITHTILDKIGIPTAKWQQILLSEMDNYPAVENRLVSSLGFPMFIKPANAGSSVGVSKAKTVADLKAALDTAFNEDTKVIAEVAIVGAEVECAVLGNHDAVAASVVGELTPAAEFYDYNAKYISGTTELHIPARIPQQISELIRTTAVAAYKALGCSGLARVDFFAKPDGSILLNEINTLPGFTSISMYPKMWQAAGVSYSDLIDKLIVYALNREVNNMTAKDKFI
ncbi:MAG: D-alanine--D-alanine ligase family protein, partial [Oscillospiraceae bacterium]